MPRRRRPSTVNDQKWLYHDFSAGKHGNIFDFVMETEGLSLSRGGGAAGRRGRAAAARRRRPKAEAREQGARLDCTTCSNSPRPSSRRALQSREGAKARGYLADRGIAPALQRQFRLGYALAEKFALRDHLAGKGATLETMIEAGLLVHGEDIAVPYDRFRDRVMFPIADRSGRIIAFGGRALDNDGAAQISQLARDPALPQGVGALQPSQCAQERA